MSFSSISAYLDPSNWQQQPNPQTGGGSSGNPQLLPQPPPPPPPHAGGRTGSTRPGSIIDRARMANIPMPETALKCPRCESTKTKFCYFNNYSLTQPRYFCKACRRYWTRGGAMRNVPVGGCSRRNKRSKGSSSSKSPAASSDQQTSSGTSPTNSLLGLPPHIPPPRILSRPSQLTEFDIGDIGLNYPNGVLNFQVGNSLLGGSGSNHHLVNYMSAGGEPWRLQPPPPPPRVISSLAVSDFPAGLYPFQGGLEPSAGYGGGDQVQPKLSTSVKMEENYKELNLSGQLLGIQANDQFWSGTSTTTSAWTDLSGFISSSSPSNPTN